MLRWFQNACVSAFRILLMVCYSVSFFGVTYGLITHQLNEPFTLWSGVLLGVTTFVDQLFEEFIHDRKDYE